ncbi:hypothetical protein LAZ67_20001241 [Cordylochernes scorpioides]|uniref:Mos1 transposase HTH domain-containing protein n=1 Tax=Cordylochernes scorpioides TaxID=51811 RepID=A0ABY6LM46_9ARAC|nr:hypothetical protein LAZ67_20001241 [Cordylochernes scorpioides]
MSSVTSPSSCFCFAVSSFGTNFAITLFMAKSSVRMECAEKVLMSTSSSFSRIVKRRSDITIAFTLAMTWSFRLVEGRPESGLIYTDLASETDAMSSFEQWANIKFCVKFKKSFTETLALMNEAYEDEKLSRTQVYIWYKRFKNGRKSIADHLRSGRPLTPTTDRNIGQVRDLIVADRKMTIDNISEILGISYGSCQIFLVNI